MRKDMGKVLCEEPRRGMRVKDRKGRKRSEARIPLDEQPKKEKGCLRRRWLTNWYNHKEFGDHVQPLRRFILSCVGRKWDDVYSEIRQTVPKGTVVNNHLYTHLFQYIATNVYIIDGVPYDGDYSSWRSRTGMPVYQDTYVHPETGIICRTPKTHRTRRTTPRKFVLYIVRMVRVFGGNVSWVSFHRISRKNVISWMVRHICMSILITSPMTFFLRSRSQRDVN